ncbi:surfeit locus protein 6-domain-containing protein [Tuber borchii]|uniref:Surfeit locus protein 6-domain-containing protein n=1 Tax=Tuber borchii TaxID=42251 RepID=A0A2T6ZZA5_TUBBO|nr:surfeit locus protein 6-domain-containing protein [Tuber borchii]
MADIEERICGYHNAFEGLLSLVPENKSDPSQLKRKQTKEESKKAKKAKLDSGSAMEGTPAKVKQGDEKRTEGGDETRKKAKMPKRRREKKPKIAVQSIGPGRSEEVESLGNESGSDIDIQMDSGDSTPHSQSTTITSPEAGELASKRAPKVELDPASRAEKRALLVARIEELRARRQAANGAGAKNRQELMEIRRKKEEARKERKKQQRLEAKVAEEAKLKEAQATREGETSQQEQLKKGPANNLSFSIVTFDDGQELDATLTNFKKTRKPKGPTDVLGQLRHVEAKKARRQTMAPEKQAKIEEKELWGKALGQATGEKIRDDEQLLKKSLKRQEQVKKKSEREWKERLENVAKSKAMKQKKREDNLAARREQKAAGKSGKRVKVGGKQKVQMKKKKKGARPGFEGSMKSKHGGGGGGHPKKGRK